MILDGASALGSGTSSRNSEVVHAGLYYPAGSLKSRLCVDGREALYRFCESHHVAYRRCGKLLVATSDSQWSRLAELRYQATGNGVHDLCVLSRSEVRIMEPELNASAALCSPSTGIVDSHGLMLALLADFEGYGGALALKSPVVGIDAHDDAHTISVGGAEPTVLIARWLVNAAGLWAPAVAGTIRGLPARCLPQARYAKGNYFSLVGRQPFSRLIYPMPEAAGLGIHLTVDLAGQARFGPDVEWLDLTDASQSTTKSIRRVYWLSNLRSVDTG